MTKFVRRELSDVLGSLRPAIAEQGLIPELSHIWFTGKSVRAFNGGLGVRRLMKTDFKCGLPGKVLLDLLATSSQEFALLDKTAEHEVTLQLGNKSKVKLARMPSDAVVWPFPPRFPEEAKEAIVLTVEFIEALSTLKFVKMSKAALVVHNGILIVPDNKGVSLYATDSSSIARVRVNNMLVKDRFLIDWKLAEQIVKLLKPGAKLLVERDRLLVGGKGGTMLASNRLELPDTPDVPVFFEKAYEPKEQVDIPKGLATTLQRAAIIASNEDPLVVFDVADKTLTVKASFSLGIFDEKIALPKSQPAVKRVFTAPLITRALEMSSKLAMTSQALSLSGPGKFAYVVATRDPGAERKEKKRTKKGK